ncbi:hypothetical protein EGR_10608 [Echinococcus granulosus]|uniref:Uncharacterized protein n=1 Tax=Echinococcus granulosus TaxID=6210 RepID=W6U0B0_ECHGR|nr:hypothetical protein EGR_10608 [Echinococcus granulosus]EUB54540.1 hypothetical protein EGR_10608 [Echinococcus granulosus]
MDTAGPQMPLVNLYSNVLSPGVIQNRDLCQPQQKPLKVKETSAVKKAFKDDRMYVCNKANVFYVSTWVLHTHVFML